ncbi:MAG: rod shape-determining protein MreD [Gammaproteobacteria bacterium TMED112]|nr:MAG: rod shape-determining protein MreD [Gammaproteobacteria bacterium TMED112]|tara:strand:- start:8257 stop:8715 length:459 start_codon:yes stop_codon:yes gene_type:complete
MNEVLRYLSFGLLIIFNQILLGTNLWAVSPDIFFVHTLLFTTFVRKIPNIYFFILMGFLIDLFFSNISMPYTLIYTMIGLYLNFSNLKWIQRSLLEQLILIILVSLFLNILLFSTNNFSDDMEIRIFINPLLNSIIWSIIFINQRQKWLRNI